MDRLERTKILIDGSRSLANVLAVAIESKYDVQILSEPQHALTMMKVRETAKNSLFHLGEVLVTETKVQIDESLGLGIVVGDDAELSYELAVIDAAYQAKLDETKLWDVLFEEEKQRIQDRKQQREQEILKTKVNFDVMDR